jgi:hypothetical protein
MRKVNPRDIKIGEYYLQKHKNGAWVLMRRVKTTRRGIAGVVLFHKGDGREKHKEGAINSIYIGWAPYKEYDEGRLEYFRLNDRDIRKKIDEVLKSKTLGFETVK